MKGKDQSRGWLGWEERALLSAYARTDFQHCPYCRRMRANESVVSGNTLTWYCLTCGAEIQEVRIDPLAIQNAQDD